MFYPQHVGLSRAFERQIYRCLTSTSACQTYKSQTTNRLRQDWLLSQLLAICLLMDETVLRDWLIYYIQAVLFVKVFVRPILKPVCNFFVRQLSCFSLRFLGRERIIFIRRFLSRVLLDQFQNSLLLSGYSLVFVTPFFGARANYTHPLFSVKGILQSNCILFRCFTFWLPSVTAKAYYMRKVK